jgi:trafficking protein particle complex subunit 13
MARPRAHSLGDGLKAPHTVSLKVLRCGVRLGNTICLTNSCRLTRPSLAQQYPLPSTAPDTEALFRHEASLAYPLPNPTTTDFILTPLLTLPESFQSAYVGEVFSCTLCANNELPKDDTTRSISGVRIGAEIISPSNPSGVTLELDDSGKENASRFGAGNSLQRILRLSLQEEGDHTLAVTVTYTETTVSAEGKAAGGKVRTFRKLYQFIAANLISVRTKSCDLDGTIHALEAQLENMGDYGVVLEVCLLNCLLENAPLIAHRQ